MAEMPFFYLKNGFRHLTEILLFFFRNLDFNVLIFLPETEDRLTAIDLDPLCQGVGHIDVTEDLFGFLAFDFLFLHETAGQEF